MALEVLIDPGGQGGVRYPSDGLSGKGSAGRLFIGSYDLGKDNW
jgi:hypothetical protein